MYIIETEFGDTYKFEGNLKDAGVRELYDQEFSIINCYTGEIFNGDKWEEIPEFEF